MLAGVEIAGNARPLLKCRAMRTILPMQEKVNLMKTIQLSNELDTIGAAVGRVASGCFVLTTQHSGKSNGLLVSWVQQAAFEPPMITACIKHGRPAAELVRGSGRFVLNVIGPDPAPMFKHFAKGFSAEEDSFAGLDVAPSDYGPLITSCVAHLACNVRQMVTAGDHDVCIAEVTAAASQGSERPYVHIRKNGLSY